MKLQLTKQDVVYTFLSDTYKNGSKTRTLKYVKPDANPDNLAAVGQAIAKLQDDDLKQTVLVQQQIVAE